MVTKTAGWTAADLERLPDDGNRYEVVDGELFVTPSPSMDHQAVSAAFNERIRPWVTARRLGWVFYAPADVHVDERNCVEPDLLVLPRTTAGRPRSWKEAPLPILVIEILSPTTEARDRMAKRTLYERAGVNEYWIVDCERRQVLVIRPGEPDRVERERLAWRPVPTWEGLQIDLQALFSEALDN